MSLASFLSLSDFRENNDLGSGPAYAGIPRYMWLRCLPRSRHPNYTLPSISNHVFCIIAVPDAWYFLDGLHALFSASVGAVFWTWVSFPFRRMVRRQPLGAAWSFPLAFGTVLAAIYPITAASSRDTRVDDVKYQEDTQFNRHSRYFKDRSGRQ